MRRRSFMLVGLTLGACTDYPARVAPHGVPGTGEADVSGGGPEVPEVIDAGVGLPCAIEEVLAVHCRSCHGATLRAEAPMALMTRQDLLAPSRLDPTRSVGALSVVRMRSATNPMPPQPGSPLPEADIAAFAAWVDAAMPSGDCAPAPDPFDTPTVCTSGRWWLEGDDGSSRMLPGEACIDCHRTTAEDDAPTFLVAGTLYPTGHEPDRCLGVSGASGTSVVVTDAAGRSYSLEPNSAGNFYLAKRGDTPFVTPYTAMLLAGDGRTRVMATAQTSGDCNSCHDESGRDGAPGRIMAP